MPSIDAVIGLGANLGQREQTLLAAVQGLAALGPVVGVSALYETEPVGPPQGRYLNAAVRLRASSAPGPLMEELLALERRLGRVRRERWGPRLIDLDLLWVAGFSCATPELTVPHPELEHRAFALLPLLDVAPEATTPAGVSYRAISMTLDRQGVHELPGSRGSWAGAASDPGAPA